MDRRRPSIRLVTLPYFGPARAPKSHFWACPGFPVTTGAGAARVPTMVGTLSKFRRTRLGVVSYLNTRPLVHSLDPARFELVPDVPSRCLTRLEAGGVDVGLIPVLGLAGRSEWRVVPEVAIGCRGAVRSVVLLSRRPLERLRSVAVDSSSRTSVALLHVLLAERWGVVPEMISHAPDWRAMLRAADAALVIGDPAMQAAAAADDEVSVTDLGREWFEHTGLPFVFAIWAGWRERLTAPVGRALIEARDRGAADLASCLDPELPATERAQQLDYLTSAISFQLDEGAVAGLQLFFAKLAAAGWFDRAPTLAWADVHARHAH